MSSKLKLKDLRRGLRSAYAKWSVDTRLGVLEQRLQPGEASTTNSETPDHSEIVNFYYDLSNEFMEFGWGDSLHFAPIAEGETLEEAVVRYEQTMIEKLGLTDSMYVIDVGCGVGGPMRRVARESGARVCCINNNQHQLDHAKLKNRDAGLDHLAEYIKCDFTDMSILSENRFDAGYAIESTCHAADKKGAFEEIFRVLKPGALLWGHEMCLTDAFDPTNAHHQRIKEELMRGIALYEIASFNEVNQILESVGFEILEASDLGAKSESSTPWYSPMEGQHSVVGNFIRRTPFGRKIFESAMRIGEVTRILPRFSSNVVGFLDRTANAYVAGGSEGIFTPLYCFLARKPG